MRILDLTLLQAFFRVLISPELKERAKCGFWLKIAEDFFCEAVRFECGPSLGFLGKMSVFDLNIELTMLQVMFQLLISFEHRE